MVLFTSRAELYLTDFILSYINRSRMGMTDNSESQTEPMQLHSLSALLSNKKSPSAKTSPKAGQAQSCSQALRTSSNELLPPSSAHRSRKRDPDRASSRQQTPPVSRWRSTRLPRALWKQAAPLPEEQALIGATHRELGTPSQSSR